MKALIRHKGETVTEEDNLSFIKWDTGLPLTDPKWFGGSYTLVQNYVPQNDVPESYEEIIEPEQVEVEDEDDYVIIDGKKYSKKELRSLLE